jgi:hypothetical protein
MKTKKNCATISRTFLLEGKVNFEGKNLKEGESKKGAK